MGKKKRIDGCGKAYESILSQSGPFGFFQKRLFIINGILQAFSTSVVACTPLLVQHGYHSPSCHTEGSERADGIAFQYNMTSPNMSYSLQNGGCKIITPESTMSLAFPHFQRIHSIGFWLASIQVLSVVIGALIGGFLSDLLGRRRILFSSFGLMAASQCVSTVSDYWQIFLALRCLSLSNAGCFLVTSMVLLQEYTGQCWRDVCACLGIWPIGMVILAFESYLIRKWQLLVVANGAACLPFLGTFFIIPESPRWLVCRGKFNDSEAAIKEMISCNSRTVTDVTSLFDRMQKNVTRFTHPRRHTYIHLFRSKALAASSLALVLMWLLNATVYIGLYDKVSVLTRSSHLNIFLPFFIDVPIVFSAIIINKCVGRRWTIFLYAMSSGFALTCVLLLHVTSNLGEIPSLVTGLALFGKLGVAASLSLICLVTLEIYPTVTRCMGCALGLTSGVLGAVIAPQVRYLTSGHYTVSFVTFGVMMIVVGFTVLVLPETSKKPLSDISPCRHRIVQIQQMRYLRPWNAT